MDETCPKCSVIHQGFEPQWPEQLRAFWQCRRCGTHLVTVRKDTASPWTVLVYDAEAHPMSLFKKNHDMIKSWATFLQHSVTDGILKLTQTAADAKAFYDGLSALHDKHEKT